MDGGGRIVEPIDGLRAVLVQLAHAARGLCILTGRAIARLSLRAGAAALVKGRALQEAARERPLALPLDTPKPSRRVLRFTGRCTGRVRAGGLGAGLAVGLFAATGIYGAELGGHWPEVRTAIIQLPDSTANLLGFRIQALTTEGQYRLSDAEILLALGITDRHSLPFLDVGAARQRLLGNPLVASATIRKLYPNRLLVSLTEREAFALWQVGGTVSIIAEDGTVIDEMRDRSLADLPLVVGPGAAKQARALLDQLGSHPAIRERLYAGVYVAERRWNLRLRNGVDVLLPESRIEPALVQLEKLIAHKDVLDRDITAVDLRFPDQIVVRLSEAAADELAKAEKAKKLKKGAT